MLGLVPPAAHAGLLRRLLAHVDEVARSRALARDVRFEVSVDVVLQLAIECPSQQSLEVLQTMRVVGQTEFTGRNKQIQIPPNRMILLCLTAVREVSNHKTTRL